MIFFFGDKQKTILMAVLIILFPQASVAESDNGVPGVLRYAQQYTEQQNKPLVDKINDKKEGGVNPAYGRQEEQSMLSGNRFWIAFCRYSKATTTGLRETAKTVAI